jgi:type I restriction enzyme S subunit
MLVPKLKFKREDGTAYPVWSQEKLGSILREYKETCKKDGTYEHISLTKEGVFPKSKRYDRDFLVTDDSKKYRVTHYNDICYNPANLKFGVICRNKYGDGIFSPIYVTFKVQNGYLPEFIEMLVTRNAFIKYTLRFQQGTVYERMAVSPEDLLSISVETPYLEEQQKIADFLFTVDEVIAQSEAEVQNLEQQKKAAMQKIFSLHPTAKCQHKRHSEVPGLSVSLLLY